MTIISINNVLFQTVGHNSEGKYFASGNKLAYRCELTPRKLVFFIEKTREGHILPLEDVSIVDIGCGVNHTIAVDRKKRCFSWGFGGYGRLGHTEVGRDKDFICEECLIKSNIPSDKG